MEVNSLIVLCKSELAYDPNNIGKDAEPLAAAPLPGKAPVKRTRIAAKIFVNSMNLFIIIP